MNPQMTPEQRQAIDRQEGCVEVEDANGKCVLMSIDLFQQLMGVADAGDFADSVAALKRSREQTQRGESRPLTDALDELGRRHGLSR